MFWKKILFVLGLFLVFLPSGFSLTGEEYVEEHNKEILTQVKSYFDSDNLDLFEGTGVCSEDISNECLRELDSICDTEGNSDIGCAVARELSGQTFVETTRLYDFISAIANPDANALQAAKFFGIEADYSNVPQLLREPFASQICLAKIDGYLDSTRETEVAGASGLTRYGCQNTVEQVVNLETTLVETVGVQNCLQVLGDIRAQRTLITPDFKTSITYSAFIRAPTDSNILYTVVVAYNQGGTQKIINLFEDLKNVSEGETANEFNTVELPINESEGEVDENSFQIGLFSFQPNGDRYIKLTTDIILIQEGDFLKPINRHQRTDSQSSGGTESNDNSLTFDDVEGSITFGPPGG